MNVQSIWAGHEYAFEPFKGNKSFPMYAKKGIAKKVEKVRGYGSERATAFVHFELEDGSEVKIRARDVIDFWDNYERERSAIIREREEAQALAQRMREQREREREERVARERAEREARERAAAERTEKLVNAFIIKTGIPRDIIASVGAVSVNLDRTGLEFWLSIENGGSHASV